jgi:hypothetical protein
MSGNDLNDQEFLLKLLSLIKRRNSTDSQTTEYLQILKQTNDQLKSGLIMDLIKSLKENIDLLASNKDNRSEIDEKISAISFPNLRLKAEILFFVFYQTQIEKDELVSLTNLLKDLSDFLTISSAKSLFENESNALTDWHSPIYLLIIILQLAHTCALQQTTFLLSREIDYYKHSINESEEGNNLSQVPGSKEGMEAVWMCEGVKGFTCLSFAIFRQPEVDSDRAPASDVEWFLHEACTMRAYSYIRLCMLPVLQAWYVEDKNTALFYFEVLCELLENLANIFTMSHYRRHESDFPYLFFPPTEQYFLQSQAFYNTTATSNATTTSELFNNITQQQQQRQHKKVESVDTLEDVLLLFTSLMNIRGDFSSMLWPSNPQQTHSYHPFVMKAVEACNNHSTLLIPTIRFVTGLAKAPLGCTAFATYWLIEHSIATKNVHFSFKHFFDCIEKIAFQMNGGDNDVNAINALRNQQQQQQFNDIKNAAILNYQITLKDVEGMVAIMELIAEVIKNNEVANILIEQFNPIKKLFSLLACAIPICLKGAILSTLSSFAVVNKETSKEIWCQIEAHKLLGGSLFNNEKNVSPFLAITASSIQQQQQQLLSTASSKGLKTELEDAESSAGFYPITCGFLQLLEALLSHGVPNELGFIFIFFFIYYFLILTNFIFVSISNFYFDKNVIIIINIEASKN